MTPRPLLGLFACSLSICLLMWAWATAGRPAQTPLEYLPPVVLAGLLVAVLLALFRPDKPMTYRILITGGRLHGRHVAVEATDEWSAMAHMRPLLDALDEPHTTWGWPVPHLPGTPDLFGDAPTVETITIDEALEALNADGRETPTP